MRIGIVVLIGLFVGLMSCRKYPEGRWLSIRSNTNRISGIWRIQKYEIQGIDSLIHMGFETHEFVFGNKSCDQSVVGRNCLSCSGDGEWFFPGGNREIISFRFFATPSPFTYAYEPDPQLTSSSWQIKQLENKEMILQSLDEARTQIIRMTLVKFNNKRPCK